MRINMRKHFQIRRFWIPAFAGMTKVVQTQSFNQLRNCFVTVLLFSLSTVVQATFLDDLAKPQSGRSMRESSTHRIGADGKFDPNGKPVPDSNSDNKSVPPGATKVLMDREGPGAITHIWITFLGPEPQDWAKAGSANHQEMLLRMTWDDQKTP